MHNNIPLISVVMVTYQHEKYIAETIESVLAQTFKDFELIIVNDGSTDKTDEVIRGFQDDRINYIYQQNQGPSAATNKGISSSKGKYIALISGDDVCYPHRLETQYHYLSSSDKKIVFSWIDIIDDDSQLLYEHPLQKHFNIVSRTRAEILNSFFIKGNDLCGVSPMIEKELLLEFGLFNLASIQMQDYDLWIKLIKKYEIAIIEESLIKYRIRSNSKNLSLNPDNFIRTTFESYQVYKKMLDDVPIELFKLSFSELIKIPEFQDGYQYELEKAFLYLTHSSPLLKSIGVEKLFDLLQNEEILFLANSKYGFGLPELYELTKNTDITNIKKQIELEQTQSQLQHQLQQTQSQLQQTQSQLDSIQSSKFWKLRETWFKFRRLMGITDESESLSLQAFLRNFKKKINIQKNILIEIEQEKWDEALPLVSVIIPCYNYGKYVEDAIDSVLNQTFPNFEIIVVDGGSTDDSTVATLKSLQKPKTTIYYREGRHLVGDNRNFGIEKAQGKYICCLDADDQLKPTYLEKALFILDVYAYDIVSASVQYFGNSCGTWNVCANPTLEEIVESNQVPTVAVFTKKIWSEASGYHDYGIGKDYISEDWDLWLRMMAMGARVYNISENLMLYRIHGQHTSLSNHPESLSFKDQAKVITSFNQKYLTPQSYKQSRQNHRISYKIVGGNINLVQSYLKESKENSRFKILFALPFVITGGADTILLQIAKHLSENNFDISVMTTVKTESKFGDNTNKYEKITQDIYHLYSFLESEAKWKDFVYYYLESRAIDILFIVGSAYFYEILPDIKKDFPNIKIVDQLFNEYGHINNNRKYAQLIDTNILSSVVIQRILLKEYQESEQKTHVVVHGVDTQKEFNPINVDEQLIRNIIPQGKFIVSYMGRFSEEKCPQMFLDVVRKLRDQKDIYFLMLGNGDEYNLVKSKITELGLNNKIYAPGFVDDNKPFLKATDLLIIPSKIEGIPIILMEGLSLGVPVIASRIGGIPDIITDGYNGFVCDPNNVNEFADKTINLFLNKNLHNQLKINARNYAEEKLDIARMNNEYINIFLSLVQGQ